MLFAEATSQFSGPALISVVFRLRAHPEKVKVQTLFRRSQLTRSTECTSCIYYDCSLHGQRSILGPLRIKSCTRTTKPCHIKEHTHIIPQGLAMASSSVTSRFQLHKSCRPSLLMREAWVISGEPVCSNTYRTVD